jgi:hypothetical protein
LIWGPRKWPQASRIRRPPVRRAGGVRKNGSKRTVYSQNRLLKNSRARGAGGQNGSPRSPRGLRPARAGSIGSHFSPVPARTGENVVTWSRFRVQQSRIEPDLGCSVRSKGGFLGSELINSMIFVIIYSKFIVGGRGVRYFRKVGSKPHPCKD